MSIAAHSGLSSKTLFVAVSFFLAFVAFKLAVALRDACFHPLNRFSGPKLAKCTTMYRAYFDLAWGGGRWIDQLVYLHSIYGPVVRVAPNEASFSFAPIDESLSNQPQLHFSHPDAYNEIYTNPKFIKDPHFYNCFSIEHSTFAQTDSKEVAKRKALMAPFFSRQSVLKLESLIQEKVDMLIHQLLQEHSTHSNAPVSMDHALRSMTLDIITTYCFAQTFDAIVAPNFTHPLLVALDALLIALWAFRHFPMIQFLFWKCLPDSIALMMSVPALTAVILQRQDVRKTVDRILLSSAEAKDDSVMGIFHSLLDDQESATPARRSHKVTRDWLVDEGLLMRAAGSDTVGSTVLMGMRYTLADEDIYRRVVRELEEAWPDRDAPMTYERLERLPYLTALIKESLRFSNGVTSPMARVVDSEGAIIAGEHVPGGTVVACTNSFVHTDGVVFPEPARFNPERWLNSDSRALERYLVSFSKGPRSCSGINLAWCELYLAFGHLFRKLDFQVTSDLRKPVQVRDFFVPAYAEDPLQVLVSEHRELRAR